MDTRQEHPIVFGVAMVRSIMDNLKTHTRRAIHPQPGARATGGYWITLSSRKSEVGKYQFITDHWKEGNNVGEPIRSPYGMGGDRLWVKEVWRLQGWDWDDLNVLVEYKDHEKSWHDMSPDEWQSERWTDWLITRSERILALPGVTCDEDGEHCEWPDEIVPWQSPIFMPRWATRLLLDVVSVRVERLQDMTEADAIAEGVRSWAGGACFSVVFGDTEFNSPSALACYRWLWDKINGDKPGCRWADNPWVFDVCFRKAA